MRDYKTASRPRVSGASRPRACRAWQGAVSSCPGAIALADEQERRVIVEIEASDASPAAIEVAKSRRGRHG
jgi:hypothetical protein